MATTIVEWEEVPGRRGSRSKRAVELKQMYEEDQRNDDKCGDSDDCTYYCGRMDALHDILYTYGWRVKGRDEKDDEALCPHDYAYIDDVRGKLWCSNCQAPVSLYAENGLVQYHFRPVDREYYRVDLDTSERAAKQLDCEHLVLKVVGAQGHRGLANVCEACGHELPERRPGDPILYSWDTQSRRYMKITEEKDG